MHLHRQPSAVLFFVIYIIFFCSFTYCLPSIGRQPWEKTSETDMCDCLSDYWTTPSAPDYRVNMIVTAYPDVGSQRIDTEGGTTGSNSIISPTVVEPCSDNENSENHDLLTCVDGFSTSGACQHDWNFWYHARNKKSDGSWHRIPYPKTAADADDFAATWQNQHTYQATSTDADDEKIVYHVLPILGLNCDQFPYFQAHPTNAFRVCDAHFRAMCDAMYDCEEVINEDDAAFFSPIEHRKPSRTYRFGKWETGPNGQSPMMVLIDANDLKTGQEQESSTHLTDEQRERGIRALCPAGYGYIDRHNFYENPNGFQCCGLCPPNTFRKIERGFFFGQVTCRTCDNNLQTWGEWGAQSYLSCQCDEGQYLFKALTDTCKPCDPGSYQADRGRLTSCSLCPAGFKQPLSSQNNCDTHCDRGEYSSSGASVCTQCPQGKFAIKGEGSDLEQISENVACQLTAQGHYAPGTPALTQIQCPQNSGTWPSDDTQTDTQLTGRWDVSQCFCNKGYTRDDSNACSACPAGTYKTQTGSASCTECSRGKASAAQAAVNANTCVTCVAGQYANLPLAATVCESCFSNSDTWKNVGDAFKSGSTQEYDNEKLDHQLIDGCKCNVGYRSVVNGHECIACETGTYNFKRDATVCIECDPGKFNGQQAATTETACQACGQGKYNPISGQSSCQPCPVDTYNTNSGSVLGSNDCKDCPRGKYSPAESVRLTDCEVDSASCIGIGETLETQTCKCRKGYAKSSTTGYKGVNIEYHNECKSTTNPWDAYNCFECEPCELNTYSDSLLSWTGSGQDKTKEACTPCPVQTETLATGSVSKSDCLCVAGWERNFGVGDFCVQCEQGKYKTSTSDEPCKSCHDDYKSYTFNQNPGSTQASECKCNAGYTLDHDANCVPCAVGKFKAEISDEACSFCPDGKFHENDGQTTIDSCELCEAGFFSNAQTLSNHSLLCSQCPAGTYSTASRICAPCDVNQYSALPGSPMCSDCENGKFSGVGSTTCFQCGRGSKGDSILSGCECQEEYTLTQFWRWVLRPYHINVENDCVCAAANGDLSTKMAILDQNPHTPGACTETCYEKEYVTGWPHTSHPYGSVGSFRCIFADSSTTSPQLNFLDRFSGGHVQATQSKMSTISYYKGDRVKIAITQGHAWNNPMAYSLHVNDTVFSLNTQENYNLFTVEQYEFECYNDLNNISLFYEQNIVMSVSLVCKSWQTNISLCTHMGQAPPGTFFDDSQVNVDDVFQPCPIGQYKTSTGTHACTSCPFAKTTLHFASESIEDCVCKAGFGNFSTLENVTAIPQTSADCAPCAPGFFKSADGHQQCLPCANNSFSNQAASTSCTACADGFHTLAPASTHCEAIPNALPEVQTDAFRLYMHPKYEFVCLNPCSAPPGSYCRDKTCLNETLSCPPGYFCPGGFELKLKCEVEPGRFCPEGTSEEFGLPCPADSFCPGGSEPSFTCPLHSTSPVESSEINDCLCFPGHGRYNDICLVCPKKTFKSGTNNEECRDCAVGFTTSMHENQGLEAVACTTCELGYYGTLQDDILSCHECAIDTFKTTEGTQACTECENGSVNQTASTALSDCLCLPGYDVDAATDACVPCRENQYKSEYSRNSCLDCPLDSTSASGTASLYDCDCVQEGYDIIGGECQTCESGEERRFSGGQYVCGLCRPGSYRSGTGVDSCATCGLELTSQYNLYDPKWGGETPKDCICAYSHFASGYAYRDGLDQNQIMYNASAPSSAWTRHDATQNDICDQVDNSLYYGFKNSTFASVSAGAICLSDTTDNYIELDLGESMFVWNLIVKGHIIPPQDSYPRNYVFGSEFSVTEELKLLQNETPLTFAEFEAICTAQAPGARPATIQQASDWIDTNTPTATSSMSCNAFVEKAVIVADGFGGNTYKYQLIHLHDCSADGYTTKHLVQTYSELTSNFFFCYIPGGTYVDKIQTLERFRLKTSNDGETFLDHVCHYDYQTNVNDYCSIPITYEERNRVAYVHEFPISVQARYIRVYPLQSTFENVPHMFHLAARTACNLYEQTQQSQNWRSIGFSWVDDICDGCLEQLRTRSFADDA